MNCVKTIRIAVPAVALACVLAAAVPTRAVTPTLASGPRVVLAQATVPATGMMDANKPMPMDERYRARFPQPARVGDLIGLPVLDLDSSTIGYVRQVVRRPAGQIELIVAYSRWWGWFGRPVAVPLEAVGIAGRQLVSLDMPTADYAAAPTWQGAGATVLPPDAIIRVALARS